MFSSTSGEDCIYDCPVLEDKYSAVCELSGLDALLIYSPIQFDSKISIKRSTTR